MSVPTASDALEEIGSLFEAALAEGGPSPLDPPGASYVRIWELAQALTTHPAYDPGFETWRKGGPRWEAPAIVAQRPEIRDGLGRRHAPEIDGGLQDFSNELGFGAANAPDGLRQAVYRAKFLLAAAAHRLGSGSLTRQDVEIAIGFHLPRIRSEAFRAFRRRVLGVPLRRLWVLSDIHLEHADWFPDQRPDFDALVVAGDVKEDAPEAVIDWVARVADGRPAVFVPGNHDFVSSRDRRRTKAEISRSLTDLGIQAGLTVLDGQEATLAVAGEPTRFLGATLWTDWSLAHLAYGDDITPFDAMDMALTARKEAEDRREGAVDFSRIMVERGPPEKEWDWRRWSVADMVAEHARMRLFLGEALVGDPGTTVVVTHHAPSPRSYGEKLDNRDFFPAWEPAFYASRQEDLIEAAGPDLWIHGHIHRQADYRIHETRIVANPRGRTEWGGRLRSGFDPLCVVEL